MSVQVSLHAASCFLCRTSQYWTSYQTQLVSGIASYGGEVWNEGSSLAMRVVSTS